MFYSLTAEIDSVAGAVDSITGEVEQLDLLKNDVMSSVESLAAIAEENAASTQETSAAMQELNEIIIECKEKTEEMVGLADDLMESTSQLNLDETVEIGMDAPAEEAKEASVAEPAAELETDVVSEVYKTPVAEEVEEAVAAVRIVGSGFRSLTHRDFLGSVLGLGLERDALGDLAVQNAHEAVLFCPKKLLPFLCDQLEKVATDTVKCMPYTPDERFTDGRRYQPISDTVASERLDCVVAALCNFSRDAAQNAVRAGLVEVEFEPMERVDYLLSAPCTISVRGQGRFVLRSFDGETRKGRVRLRADRLI